MDQHADSPPADGRSADATRRDDARDAFRRAALLLGASLGGALVGQGRYERAEPLLGDALRIAETALGTEHGITAVILRRYAALLTATGRDERARELGERATAVGSYLRAPLEPPDRHPGPRRTRAEEEQLGAVPR